ncbi:MAG TPA: NADH-quinone oxidoreductase subunit M [Acidobacteriaceae bacterium]
MTSIDHNILTWILLLPALGAVVTALLPNRGKLVQSWALIIALATFVLTLHLPTHFDYNHPGFQFEINRIWIASPPIRYHLGVDGLSVWLLVLTGFLAPIGVLASWRAIDTRVKEFYSLFLLQQTAMLGVFLALDLMVYYAFWELSLVPMAILIATFGRDHGSRASSRAAIKFFLYTFIPSALFLVGILALYARTGTFDYVEMKARLTQGTVFGSEAMWLISLSFLVAFAVKVPVFPLHGWLGDVFSEAPTAMAMVVAGKLGLYSLIRFHLGLFPFESHRVAHWMILLAALGILYGALVALVQNDLKRLLAFGTVSSLSFCTLGIYTFALNGLDGAVFHILSESITGGALLVLFGVMYERYGTYEIERYGGLAARVPRLATVFLLSTLALIGLPILNGFVGEFLTLSSGFAVSHLWGSLGTIGVILSAAYMLWMVQRVFYGPESPLVHRSPARDLATREHLALWPMAILMVLMGVFSPYWIRVIDHGVHALSNTPAVTHNAAAAALVHGRPPVREGE